ncbi:M48 family metalloprotease [Aureimonas sp. AU12]|uniref:M48 family metalloprotease n=1 Tax=Aureimonas sp. AU12 TaxID=1638161 RepID=UPI0007813614|nr:M48 family metalloprotease [Aureimonas sp. AU12]
MKVRSRHWAARALTVFLASAIAAPVLVTPAAAQRAPQSRLPVVRDAEIEALVKDYATPILKAAGLSPNRVEIVLVNDLNFNAFVAGRRIFINTGTILESETPNETIGVIAHEVGHLAGGHQERLRDQIARAQTIAVVASLLGAGVAAAGAAAGSGAVAGLGGGLLSSGGGIAQRGLFAYQRTEETTADRSALTYLQKTGQSPNGLLQSFEGLQRKNMLSGVSPNQYLSSHPAPQDRIGFLQTAAHESPFFDKVDSPALQLRHDLARAKIAAYNGGAQQVRRTFGRDLHSLPALYGDAIATHLAGSPAMALSKVDALIKQDPNNPWFLEFRGEVLLVAGRSEEAAAAFTKASKLDPTRSGLIQSSIGQAIVTGGKSDRMRDAIGQIERGLEADPGNSTAYQYLARAYGAIGEVGSAELATAEGYWEAGNVRQAKIFAARAQQKFRPGTPQWRKAQDIITTRVQRK